ncbi:hypothetical protein ADINL_1568 [Nitrincola lacisaponensis]|uniref:PilZ domain-containing protein n=1 Tax=Nitrincola lacisaponensis TaxID=267850 RepID=A0A063Y591_9GAMM|nr:PilZ domain-containing protein [Nitrincola lacisaponensis]KDE39931.1 hypothetical protein ADINL_1568 [Nitrincola lacisaponensis]
MEQDRRQFYRIDKWVALEFHLIDPEMHPSQLPAPGTFKVSPHFMLHAELQQLNAAINQQLDQPLETAVPVAKLLQLMNQKMDIIARSLTASDELGFNIRTDRVNLSEGGLSFNTPDSIELGRMAIVRLIMPESETGIRLLAEVKRCEQKQEHYELGLEFQRMPEVCRTELVRLILRSQLDQHHTQHDDPQDD